MKDFLQFQWLDNKHWQNIIINDSFLWITKIGDILEFAVINNVCNKDNNLNPCLYEIEKTFLNILGVVLNFTIY